MKQGPELGGTGLLSGLVSAGALSPEVVEEWAARASSEDSFETPPRAEPRLPGCPALPSRPDATAAPTRQVRGRRVADGFQPKDLPENPRFCYMTRPPL